MDAELADVDSTAIDGTDEGVEEPAAPEDARQAKLRQLRERLVRRPAMPIPVEALRPRCYAARPLRSTVTAADITLSKPPPSQTVATSWPSTIGHARQPPIRSG